MFFLYPMVLFLLLLPFALFVYGLKTDSTPLESVFSKAMQEKLFLSSKQLSKHLKNRLFLLVIALLIIALARPVERLESLDTQISKASVVLAIDVSKSMHQNDVYPSRIALAQEKMKQVIEKSTGLNIGILLYAQDAYRLYPISENPQTLLTLLEQGELSRKFKPNSNLFSALEGSVQLLKGYQNKHILLFSDGGEEVERSQELAYLKKEKIVLSSLALHQNEAMKQLVKETKGAYKHYTWGSGDIDSLIKAIKKHKTISATKHYEIAQYKEYFQLPLGLAIVILLLFYIPLGKKNPSSLLLLFFVMSSYNTPLQAGVFDFWYLHQAKEAYDKAEYKEAIGYYQKAVLTPQGYYNLATSHYKNKAYLEAIKAYRKAFSPQQSKQREAKIYHNIATAYVRMRKFDIAKKYYIQSLSLYHSKESSDNLKQMIALLKVQRKNVHKKYEKLEFKGIGKNVYAPNSMFSNYAIRLTPLVPSEEEKWFKRIAKIKSPFYLQKLTTHIRSQDANVSH